MKQTHVKTKEMNFQNETPYQIEEKYVFVITSNLGVRGVYRTAEEAIEKETELVSGIYDDPNTIETTRIFFEIEVQN